MVGKVVHSCDSWNFFIQSGKINIREEKKIECVVLRNECVNFRKIKKTHTKIKQFVGIVEKMGVDIRIIEIRNM